jgi:serine phosphatase RsbU (regulator of sigma subunit)
VLTYTDGISEVENPGHEEYGVDRLLQCARQNAKLPMTDVLAALAADATAFSAGKGFDDDVCLVAAEAVRLPPK